MTIRKTKLHGLEMFQIVRDNQVVYQAYSMAGLVTWIKSQKAGV